MKLYVWQFFLDATYFACAYSIEKAHEKVIELYRQETLQTCSEEETKFFVDSFSKLLRLEEPVLALDVVEGVAGCVSVT